MERKAKRDEGRRAQKLIAPLDVDEGVQLPNIMGWAGCDYLRERSRYMEEVAEELSTGKRSGEWEATTRPEAQRDPASRRERPKTPISGEKGHPDG